MGDRRHIVDMMQHRRENDVIELVVELVFPEITTDEREGPASLEFSLGVINGAGVDVQPNVVDV